MEPMLVPATRSGPDAGFLEGLQHPGVGQAAGAAAAEGQADLQ